MRNSICRSLRSAITPRPTLRFLGVSELYHPATTTPPPRQPNAATNKGHTPSDLLTDRLSAPRAHHHPLTTLNQIFNLQGFHTAAFSLHKHDLKTLACNDVGTRGFSAAAAVAAPPPPTVESKEIRAKETGIGGTAKKVISFTLLPNLALFWHINEGIEEILSDYVHQEMTRNLIAINLRLFLIIIAKDVFLSLV